MRTTRAVLAAAVFAAAFASVAAYAQAARGIAKLTNVQGNVLVSGESGMSAATSGQVLAPGVRVITTAGAKATVSYDKGCEVALGEDRRYTVREQAECSAAKAPPLGAAAPFVVLAGSTVPSAGQTVVEGELGVSPGTGVTGFPPGRVTGGSIHAADEKATQAQKDAVIAYNDLASQTCNTRLTGQDLGGQTLTPGVFCFSPARLTGELVLDAQGDPGGIFIFQVGGPLTVGDKATIKLVNGALSCNVYWQVAETATIGSDTKFAGSLLAIGGINVGANTGYTGRAFSRTGTVNLNTNSINVSPCLLPPPFWATPGGAALGAAAAIGIGAGIYEATRSKSPN